MSAVINVSKIISVIFMVPPSMSVMRSLLPSKRSFPTTLPAMSGLNGCAMARWV